MTVCQYLWHDESEAGGFILLATLITYVPATLMFVLFGFFTRGAANKAKTQYIIPMFFAPIIMLLFYAMFFLMTIP